MVTLKLTATGSDEVDSGEPTNLTGKGETVLIALGNLDKELFDLSGQTMSDDFAIEWDQMMEKFSENESYSRRDFSSPEDNFIIEITRD